MVFNPCHRIRSSHNLWSVEAVSENIAVLGQVNGWLELLDLKKGKSLNTK